MDIGSQEGYAIYWLKYCFGSILHYNIFNHEKVGFKPGTT